MSYSKLSPQRDLTANSTQVIVLESRQPLQQPPKEWRTLLSVHLVAGAGDAYHLYIRLVDANALAEVTRTLAVEAELLEYFCDYFSRRMRCCEAPTVMVRQKQQSIKDSL